MITFEEYICEKCGADDASYEGPQDEMWCVDCYSGWADYEYELHRDELAEAD